MPEFTIVAGPNGAGKSTLWSYYVRPGTEYFNGDIVFSELQLKYPLIAKDSLAGGVAVALERAVEKAINGKLDFAFESTFSANMAVELTNKFKEEGYNTSLVYFGIETLSDSKGRVILRTQCGGHNVDKEVIEYNFTEGIKKVNENLHIFDTIFFVDNRSLKEFPTLVAYLKGGSKALLDENVRWFNAYFKESFLKLKTDNSFHDLG